MKAYKLSFFTKKGNRQVLKAQLYREFPTEKDMQEYCKDYMKSSYSKFVRFAATIVSTAEYLAQ